MSITILKILAAVAILNIVFLVGYSIGRTPDSQEKASVIQDAAYKKDLYDLSGKYNGLYNLCENKYQAALDGDITGAYQIKAQMDQLQLGIAQIIKKYSISGI